MITDRLREVIEPGVNALGYELVLLEYEPRKKRGLLRIYIDHDSGVGLKDCEAVSRQVSAILDVEDPIANQFDLEVSSPGIDRPLVKEDHFKKVIGQNIRFNTHDYYLGRRRFLGNLLGVENGQIIVEADNEQYEIPISDIDKARLEPDWSKI